MGTFYYALEVKLYQVFDEDDLGTALPEQQEINETAPYPYDKHNAASTVEIFPVNR